MSDDSDDPYARLRLMMDWYHRRGRFAPDAPRPDPEPPKVVRLDVQRIIRDKKAGLIPKSKEQLKFERQMPWVQEPGKNPRRMTALEAIRATPDNHPRIIAEAHVNLMPDPPADDDPPSAA